METTETQKNESGSMVDPELKRLAEQTANRLRLLQVDFAQESADVQNEYLKEELGRTLKAIHPQQKRPFLCLLKALFPISFDGQEGGGGQPAVFPESKRPERPEELLDRFLAMFSNLPFEEQQTMLAALQAGGITCRQEASQPSKQLDALKSLFPLREEASVSMENLLQVTHLMLEMFFKLDSLVQNTWMWMNSQKSHSGASSLKNAIGSYITEGTGSVPQPMVKEVRQFQQLVTGLITGISRAGQKFSESFMSRYSAQEIAKLVQLEGAGVLTSHNAKCWKKYQELSAGISRDSVEKEICTILTDYVNTIRQLEQRQQI